MRWPLCSNTVAKERPHREQACVPTRFSEDESRDISLVSSLRVSRGSGSDVPASSFKVKVSKISWGKS